MEYDTNTANICTDLGICHGHANRSYFRSAPRIIFVNCHRSANLINLCSRTIFCSSYSQFDKAGRTFPEKYEIRLTWNITRTILSKCRKSNVIPFRERNHLHNVPFPDKTNAKFIILLLKRLKVCPRFFPNAIFHPSNYYIWTLHQTLFVKSEYWIDALSSWWFIFSNINLLSFKTIYEFLFS